MIRKDNDLLGSLLHDVAHLIRLDIDSALKKHNLTRVKWLALGIIQQKNGLTQAELATDLELGAAAVGRLVDRLVERDFVERKQDLNDRRAYQLFLKPGVNILLQDLEITGDRLRENILRDISDQEIELMSHALKKIKRNLMKIISFIQLSMVSRFCLETEWPAFGWIV